MEKRKPINKYILRVLEVVSGMFSWSFPGRSKIMALEIRRAKSQNEREASTQTFVARVALSLFKKL